MKRIATKIGYKYLYFILDMIPKRLDNIKVVISIINTIPIASVGPANNGKITLSTQAEILGLVFGVFDIEGVNNSSFNVNKVFSLIKFTKSFSLDKRTSCFEG